MSILNGRIAGVDATPEAQSAVGTMLDDDRTESTFGDLRGLGRNDDDKPPAGTVTASVPTAEEGLRLIQAFRQITDPRQRRRLIEEAEAMAKGS